MQLTNLKQAPFNTTMMGVMRGALDCYGIEVSDAALYGASGHAFLLNIHKQICPSGPYCWKRKGVESLLANVGLRVEPLGFFWSESSLAERSAVEARLRECLGDGIPCSLLNMENQLITGWDDTGFLTAQPWSCADFPPKHLTFGTWQELGGEVHIDFYVLNRTAPADPLTSLEACLKYAVDLWKNPSAHTQGDYGVGPDGYNNWIEAVQEGHGAGHGNWWNGTVWSECRARAADYLQEVAGLLPPDANVLEIANGYAEVAALLEQCSSKELEPEAKVARLSAARDRELACIELLEKLLAGMV